MIFGKTYEQQDRRLAQALIQKILFGVRSFAWLPCQLADGRWAWLRTVYTYYQGTWDSSHRLPILHYGSGHGEAITKVYLDAHFSHVSCRGRTITSWPQLGELAAEIRVALRKKGDQA